MFCVHCGADSAANFCRQCGQRQPSSNWGSLQESAKEPTAQRVGEIRTGSDSHQRHSRDSSDWIEILDYHRLLECQQPRRRIAQAMARSKPGVTGDDVLAILEAVSPSSISLSKLTHAVVPVMDKLGFRTSRVAQAVWQAEPGRVLLAFLCVLASRSLTVDDVQQSQSECTLSVKLPLGVITNPGKILARLETQAGWVRISLSVTISGQWFDWGKSNRCIQEMMEGIHADLVDQYSGRSIVYQRVA